MPAGTPVYLGAAFGDPEATSMAITTLAAIPDGALVFVGVGFYNNTTLSGNIAGDAFSVGDVHANPVDSQDRVGVLRRINTGAKSSGATLTIGFSGTGAFGRTALACYVPSVSSATPASNGGNSATTSAWDSGAATAGTADGIALGYVKLPFRTTTSTPDANSSEIADVNDATMNFTFALYARTVSADVSVAVGGTWADGGPQWVATHEVFPAVAAAPAVSVFRSRRVFT